MSVKTRENFLVCLRFGIAEGWLLRLYRCRAKIQNRVEPYGAKGKRDLLIGWTMSAICNVRNFLGGFDDLGEGVRANECPDPKVDFQKD